MDNQKSRLERYVDWFLYIALVFVLSHMLGIGITISHSTFYELIVVIFAAIIARYIVFYPISIYFASVAGIFGLLIANRYFKEDLKELYSWLIGFSDNIINNIRGKENILYEYQIPFILLMAFVISVLTTFVIFRNKSIFLLIPPHIFAYLMYWYSFRNEAFWLLAAFIVLFLILLSNKSFNAEKISGSKRNIVRTNASQLLWLTTGVKYSIIIAVIAIAAPKTDWHLELPWLESRVQETFPFVADLRSSGQGSRSVGEANAFNFSVTGFQAESSRLGGPVDERNDQVMTVKSSRSLYLRGNVKQIYTGESWEAITEPSRIFKLTDDVSGIEDDEKDLYYDRVEAVITFRDFSSTTLFSPLFPEILNSFDARAFVMGRDSFLVLPGGLYDGESYYLSALVPKPYGIRLANGADESSEELQDKELYLNLPRSISERTIELTNRITDGLETPYEKAAAIEAYLRDNFSYRHDVDQVPGDVDFVDNFLFEENEGYCTYYASAMVVMLRIADIPSVYIEGFVARGPADDGLYSVTYNNAHSWVEAFIEPVGWMTFEPTPALPIPLRLEGYSSEEPDPSEQHLPGSYGRDPDDLGQPEEPITEDQNITADEATGELYILIALLSVATLLGIIPGQMIYGSIKHKKRKQLISSMDPQRRLVHQYADIIDMLGILGYKYLPGETHTDHAKRIAYKFNDISGASILKISDAFVKAKYGNITPDEEILLSCDEFLDALEEKAKKHLGRLKFLYLKYTKWIKKQGR